MNVSFLNLTKQYNSIQVEINSAIAKVVKKQRFILGEEVAAFEHEFARYLGAKHVIGVNSGTDALILALRSLGVGKGDEVITQPNSFIATTLAILEVGATPIFVDINPDTYQIDENLISEKITSKTKAILPVHMYGAPCNIEKIAQIAKEHKLFLIEDACQAVGSSFSNKKVGTFGELGTFSFYPGKNLGAYGDGGAICTNNTNIYKKLLSLRNYGQTEKYIHNEIGVNSRLDEIQAAVLRVKLKNVDRWNVQRRDIANTYKKLLKDIKVQKILENSVSNYHLFVIQVSNRDELGGKLLEKGIETKIHYPIPIHLQKCYGYLGYKKGDFPLTDVLSQNVISLPLYSELTSNEISFIINTTLEAIKSL